MRLKRLATAMGMAALTLAILATPARAGSGLEDILYEKGQISKDDWIKAKAAKEKETAETTKAASSTASKLLKGVELKATFYFDFTYAKGDSFANNAQFLGINSAQANNNKSLANGFHFTRTYLTLIKRFDEGHHFRLTLDQMVNNVGGNSCPNGLGGGGGKCHEAGPFGLDGYSSNARNSTFVKYAYYNHIITPGVELRIGQHQTPWIEYEEHRWTYRYQAPTFVDQQSFQTSSDMGVSLLGKVLDKRVDYHLQFANGEGYQNTPDARSYAWLGRLSVEPLKGVILSGFVHTETLRNGVEGFNPFRTLGNIEVYDPESDRFKINGQWVYADDGADIGTNRAAAFNVPSTYNGNVLGAPVAATYGGKNGPATGTPRFHDGQGWQVWGYYRIPGLEKTRLYSRYYFMKPNKSTLAGENQSMLFGVSYDYSKYLSVALDYTLLKQTVLGSNAGSNIHTGGVPGQIISTGGINCTTCGRFVDYDNQIFGVKVLVHF